MIANRQDLKQGLLDAASWNTDQVMICATLRDASLVSAASDVPIANPRRKRLDFDEAYLSGFEWITRKKRFALADVRSVIRSRCGPDKRLRQRSPVRPLRVRPRPTRKSERVRGLHRSNSSAGRSCSAHGHQGRARSTLERCRPLVGRELR